MIALSAFSFLFGGRDADTCADVSRHAQAVMQRIRTDWPLRGAGDPVSVYVQGLGDRLARRAGVERTSAWHFYVVRNLAPNAFALGAGHFVVTDGLFALVQNESELAAVLAHEMGHDLAGHFCRGDAPDSETFSVGSLTQEFDPAAEAQADALAVDLLKGAGFDPGALPTVLRCIAARSSPANRAELQTRIHLLANRGLTGGRQATSDSRGFREARREVLSDLPGTGSALGYSRRPCE
jgi:beta-barrel assembly-enhancing protease